MLSLNLKKQYINDLVDWIEANLTDELNIDLITLKSGYRAADTAGQTIAFLLAAKRDAVAALRFFRKAIRHHGEPDVVTIDKSGANTAALATLNAGKADGEAIKVSHSKYLHNIVEQDRRNIRRRRRLMTADKSFRWAQTVLAGIELKHMARQGQLQHPEGSGRVSLQPVWASKISS